MRRTLGTTVFSGMLGVTIFGIFLTPVFFFVIDWLGESRLFTSRFMRPLNAATLSLITLGLLPGSDRAPATTREARPAPGFAIVATDRLRRIRFTEPRTPDPCFHASSSIGRSSPRCCRSSSPWPAGSRSATLPIAQYPEITPPTVEVSAILPRRQRPGRGRHRGRADRAAGQRRREHAVHVVAVHQRRHLHAHGHLQARRRPEHGAGAGAEPRVAGRADPARPGQAPRA